MITTDLLTAGQQHPLAAATTRGAGTDHLAEAAVPAVADPREGLTLNDLLAARVRTAPEQPFAEVRGAAGAPWRTVTVAEFDAEVVTVAKGLVARGVRPGEPVGIMSRTRYEWTLLDFAVWAAGAVPVPLYETSSAEQVEWVLTNAEIGVLVVETPEHATTVESVRGATPGLREVLVLDAGAVEELSALGADVPDEEIARRRRLAAADDLATIIYTSGTTGRPKGVELTHRNFSSLALNTVAAAPEVFESGTRTLLFLPLAHVFARFIEVVAVAGGVVLAHTSDPKDMVDDVREFRPTFLLAVPRVFEKIYNAAEQKAAQAGRRGIFHWAVRVAIAWSRALDTKRGPSVWLGTQHAVADLLVYRKLRNRLGGRARFAVSGGSPLGERLGHFYRGVGLVVLEGYGLTESTAPTTVNLPGRTKVGTVGLPLPGTAVRIAADGEILLRGSHIFRGYRNDPRATAEAFDGDWFRTGDLGELDDDGFLTITGRKKEIIVTAGGKNVAPAVLEDRVRAHPLVSQCVVVGDDRPFVGALLTLDPEGLPGWLTMHGRGAMSVEEAKTDRDVLDALRAAIVRANRAVSKAESIRRFTFLPGDLTVDNGYLTPKQSLRRDEIVKDFAAEIEAVYGQDHTHVHDVR